MLKIGHRAEGLVDVLKIGLHIIGSNIMPKGSNITLEDWMSWESRHTGGMDDIPKERTIC